MTKDQIEKWEYCNEYMQTLETYKKNLPFGIQNYGCGTGRPSIEFTLEKIHKEMYNKIQQAMKEATNEVQKIIEEI